MWTSPSIRDHVIEDSDYRLGKLINTVRFDAGEQSVGDYRYVYSGKYSYIEVPDFSADKIMNNIHELRHIAEEYTFTPEAELKSPSVAHTLYGVSYYFPMVLVLNNIPSNALFTYSKTSTLQLLAKEQLFNFISEASLNRSRTVRKITNIEEMDDIKEALSEQYKDTANAIDEWLEVKIPNADFENIQDTPEYQRLLDEYGLYKLEDYVSRLDKYRRVNKPLEGE